MTSRPVAHLFAKHASESGHAAWLHYVSIVLAVSRARGGMLAPAACLQCWLRAGAPVGVLSMGRYDDPNSGTSSFSILLGDAPHLNMQYTIFGKMTRGMDVIHQLESLPTRKEGIFVMPLKRITIVNTYWYTLERPHHLTLATGAGQTSTGPGSKGKSASCESELAALQDRYLSVSAEVQELRAKLLPG